MPCDGAGTGDLTTGALDIGQFLDTSKNPPGLPYKQTPVPAKQRNMPAPRARRRDRRARRPRVDLAAIAVPAGG